MANLQMKTGYAAVPTATRQMVRQTLMSRTHEYEIVSLEEQAVILKIPAHLEHRVPDPNNNPDLA
ncbi:MAG: hypothetical protein IT480_11955 [Gammaproteobacteria bacterium]|nr:hypothetical protein [Gammaproteobacteria bacterium]